MSNLKHGYLIREFLIQNVQHITKKTTLWDASGNTIEVHMDEDVDLIEVPTFNVGDLVLYKGTVDQYDNQLVTITYIYDTKFMPYRVNDCFQATPFELHKIEY